MRGILAFAVTAVCLLLIRGPAGVSAESDPDQSEAVDATTAGPLDGAALKSLQDKLRAETVVINGTIGLDGVHHFYGAAPVGQDKNNAVRYWTASSFVKSKPHNGNTTLSEPPGGSGQDDPEHIASIWPHPAETDFDTIALASVPTTVLDTEMELGISGAVSSSLYDNTVDSVPTSDDLASSPNNSIATTLGTSEHPTKGSSSTATVTNVIQVAMRASHYNADMAFDRAIGYGSALANIAAVTGSDAGLAAEILNASVLNRFWASAIGQWDKADDRGGVSGYRYDARGFATGYDRAVRNLILGGSYSYTTGDYVDKAARAHDSSIDNHAMTLYAAYCHRSGLVSGVVAGYTFSDSDIREFQGDEWLEQSFSTTIWYLSGKVGYEFTPTENFSLTPTVGFGYIDARSSAHNGIRGADTDHRHGRMTANTAFVPVELRAAYTYRFGQDSDLQIRAKGGYTYNFDATTAHGNVYRLGTSGGQPGVAVGRDTGHGAYKAGVGIWYRSCQMNIGINYDYTGMAEYRSHRVTLSASVKF